VVFLSSGVVRVSEEAEVPDLKNEGTEITKETEKTINLAFFVTSVDSVASFLRSGTSVLF
jgi:hypothetical protein